MCFPVPGRTLSLRLAYCFLLGGPGCDGLRGPAPDCKLHPCLACSAARTCSGSSLRSNSGSAAGTKLPVIPITIHHQPVDQKILNDDTDFGFTSTTVPPHSTRAGYVFYDTRGLDDPVMKGAELYIKEIKTTDNKGAPQELFAFTLSFDKWLAAKPEKPSKTPDPKK